MSTIILSSNYVRAENVGIYMLDRDFENAQCFEDIVHLINLRAVADWIKVIIHQYLMTFLMIASPMYFPDKIQFEIGEYVNIVLG